MKNEAKQNVGILMFQDVEVLDFAGPFEVFSVTAQLNADQYFRVFTLAKNKQPILAVNRLSVNVDYDLQDHPSIDILVIPGGVGTRAAMVDNQILSWVRKNVEASELTLSICSGARIVGVLGLLENRPFCTHHQVYEHMKEISPSALPHPEKRFIQSSDKLFTAGGITAGIDLSFHVVEKLCGASVAEQTAKYMEYSRNT